MLLNYMVNRIEIYRKRDSNFELLRIVAMLFIICHHFVVHGLMKYECSQTTFYISQLFFPLGKIAYVSFIVLTMWYLCDSKFKSSRFLRLFFEVIFYSLIMGILTYTLTDNKFGTWTWISLLFPIGGAAGHNYIAVYLCFYLLYPFLLIILNKVNNNQLLFLSLVLFFIQVITYIITALFSTGNNYASNVILFIFMFYFISYLKRNNFKILNKKIILSFSLVSMWLIMYLINIKVIPTPTNEVLKRFINKLYEGESTIMDLIAGISLFFLFKTKKQYHNVVINIIASPSLGILLVHDNELFKLNFWKIFVHPENFANLGCLLLIVIPTLAILIFTICGLIDYIRKMLIENNVFKLEFINKFSNWIDKIIYPIVESDSNLNS